MVATLEKPKDDLTTIRQRLEAVRRQAAKARERLEAAEAELDNVLVSRELGQRVSDDQIRRLESKRDQAQRELAEAERLAVLLDARVAEMDAQQAAVEHQRRLAELQTIAAEARRLEEHVLDAAKTYANLAQKLTALQSRYDNVAAYVSSYAGRHGEAVRLPRRPYLPPEVPASVIRGRQPVDAWLASWRAAHPAED